MKTDDTMTIVDCTAPLYLVTEDTPEEEKIPDADGPIGIFHQRPDWGYTPSLNGAGLRIPATARYSAHLPRRGPHLEEDFTTLGHALRRSPIAGLSLSLLPPITDRDLLALGEQPGLRWLDLSHAHITNAGLSALLGFPNLEWLRLCDVPVTDLGLMMLRRLPRLRHLNLASTKISAAGLRHLTALPALANLVLDSNQLDERAGPALAALRELRHLSLSHTLLRPEGVAALAALPHLTSLRYSGPEHSFSEKSRGLSQVALEAVGSLPGLTRLDLHHYGHAEDLTPIAGLPRLTHLRLSQARTLGTRLAPLLRAPRLRSLDLSHLHVEEEEARVLGQMTGLSHLNLDFTSMDDAAFRHLGGLAGLVQLRLVSTWVSDRSVATLAGMKGLRTLTFLSRGQIRGTCLSHLCGLHQLVELNLDGVKLDAEHFAYFALMPQLQRLALGNINDSMNERRELIREIAPEGFAHLAHLKQLRLLSIVAMTVRDDDLRYLRDLHTLEDLSVNLSEIRGPGLRHLEGLPVLHELCLDLSYITDEHLGSLRELPALRALRLQGAPITDVGLRDTIGHLTQLELLDLTGTNISDAGIAHLRGLSRLRWLWVYQCDNLSWQAAHALEGRPGHLSVTMEREKEPPALPHPRAPIQVIESPNEFASGPLN